MKKNIQSIPPHLRVVICFFFVIGLVPASKAQYIYTGATDHCVAATSTDYDYFSISGVEDCASVYWYMSASAGYDYTLHSDDGSSFSVLWNRAVPGGVYIHWTYSNCSGSGGDLYSSTFYVRDIATPTVSIAQTSGSNPSCQGSSVTFTATAFNAGTNPSYTWKVNGSTVFSGSRFFTTTALNNGNSISVSVNVDPYTAGCVTQSSATSNSIGMSITTPATVSLSISGTTTVCPGGAASFSVGSTQNVGGSPSYQWYINGSPTSGNDHGMGPLYLFIDNWSESNNATVYCKVTSSQSCITGSPATSNTVTVGLQTPVNPGVSISYFPLHYPNYCAGETITFTAVPINGGSMPTYSWSKNGIPIGSGVSYSSATWETGDYMSVTMTSNAPCVSYPTSTDNTQAWPTLTIVPMPTFPGTQQAVALIDSIITLTASGAIQNQNQTYGWFTSTGTYITEGITYTTPVISSNTTYQVSVRSTLESSCESSKSNLLVIANDRPVVTVNNLSVALPAISAQLTGTIADNVGGISTRLWRKRSGQSVTLSDTTTNTLTVSNIKAGSYVFRLTATDTYGYSNYKDMTLTVSYPPNNYNFVKEEVIEVSGVANTTAVTSLSEDNKTTVINYMDGLGRPMETVSVQASPLHDVIQPIVYDVYGREVKKYLPYVSAQTSGYYISNPVGTSTYTGSAHANYYSNGSADKVIDDGRPFNETTFENSPLNRPDTVFGPGDAWHTPSKKYVKYSYPVHKDGTSAGQERVIAWKLDATTGLPVRTGAITNYTNANGYYVSTPSPQLTIRSTKDEQGRETREYTNKLGQVILKKVQLVDTPTLNNKDHWTLTYYVYDDMGLLRFVLQPELSKIIHTNDTNNPTPVQLDELGFQYKYDSRQRMSEKKVAGAGWVYMVYDDRDRLVLTQDANQRVGATNAIKYWTFTKYDLLNRPIFTGIKDTTTTVQLTQAQMQSAVNTYYSNLAVKTWRRWGESYVGAVAGNMHGYSNRSYPVSTTATVKDPQKYLTVTYYDNYNFKNILYDSGSYSFKNDELSGDQAANYFRRLTNQVTGTKVKVLDGGTMTGRVTWLSAVNYYDEKYRLIQTHGSNYKGGIDKTTMVYDFTGKPLKTKTTHTTNDVRWKDAVGISVAGNWISKSATTTDWTSGGIASSNTLSSSQDGWLEFTVPDITTRKMIGLASSNPNLNYTSINYALDVDNTTLRVYELGVAKYTTGTVTYGDVLRVERTGTTVKYKKNGIVFYTSATASSSILMVDVSMYTPAALLTGIRTSFTATTQSITRRFEYDHAGRLLKTWHKLNSEPEIILSENEYNELGQVVAKKIHASVVNPIHSNFAQVVDYRYNIRGWLTKMNESDLAPVSGDRSDFFGMQIAYNDDISTGNSATLQYNGNISAIKWSSNLALGTVKENAYNYTYDPLNRIADATFKEKSASWNPATNSAYSESGYSYDQNGNIKGLTRKGAAGANLDVLTYTYATASNKLVKVADTGDANKGFIEGANIATEYTYDGNGSMITDQNKGITTAITYNYLNLPEVVYRGTNAIRYIYDASGRKLAQYASFNSNRVNQTDYVGEFQYESGDLKFISHEEGRIVVAGAETVSTHSGSAVAGITAVTSTLAPITQNGETYVRATAVGTTAMQGMFPVGNSISVQAGERYKIRIKGYYSNTTTNYVDILIKVNGTNLDWPGSRLPQLYTGEAWAEQVITIPTGGTSLQAGAVWNTVTSGQQFFMNEFEIVKLVSTSPEYQYTLKDHLGNARVTFTTKNDAQSATATMETANAASEQSKFINYAEAIIVNSTLFDHTNTSPTYYSTRLNGTANEKTGLAQSLSVMPGDTITAEVFVKYLDTNNGNWTTALANFMAAIAGGTAPAGTVIDGGTTGSIGSGTFPFPGLLTRTDNGTGPKAYLNYLVFDRNYGFKTGGFKQITSAAREYGNDGAHERLAFDGTDRILIKEPGYVYLWISNDNTTPVEVYFDDFKVTHTKSPVIQTDDYYSGGLRFNSYTRENSLFNKRLYNAGSELQTELDLGVYQTDFRMYDPAMDRWWQPDPLADEFYNETPYNYSHNNPIRFNDPKGDCPECDIEEMTGVIAATVSDGIKGLGNIILAPFGKELSNEGNGITLTMQERQAPTSVAEAFLKPVENALNASSILPSSGPASSLLAKTGQGVKNMAADAVGSVSKAVHGNSKLSTKPTTLYKLETKTGEHLKTGVTSKSVPEKRYTNSFMKDKQMKTLDKGTRANMLKKERDIVEKNPGPLNKEPWAGKKAGEN